MRIHDFRCRSRVEYTLVFPTKVYDKSYWRQEPSMAYTLVHFLHFLHFSSVLRLFRKLENFFLFPYQNFRPFKILLSVTHCSLDICPCDKYVYSYVITTFQQLSWRSHHFWRSWTLFIFVIGRPMGGGRLRWWCVNTNDDDVNLISAIDPPCLTLRIYPTSSHRNPLLHYATL